MKTIDALDKKSLRDYVDLINKDQDKLKISLSFKISQVDDNEYCAFTINGKLCIKHSLDEAISFLDGILMALDFMPKECEHNALESIVSTTGDTWERCPICNYSKQLV